MPRKTLVLPKWSHQCDADYEYRATTGAKGFKGSAQGFPCEKSTHDELHVTADQVRCCRPSKSVLRSALNIPNLVDGRWLLRQRFHDLTKRATPQASRTKSRSDVNRYAVQMFREAEKRHELKAAVDQLEAHRQDRLTRLRQYRKTSQQQQGKAASLQQKPNESKPLAPVPKGFIDVCRASVSKAAKRYWKVDPCFSKPHTTRCRAWDRYVDRFLPTIIQMYHLAPQIVYSPNKIFLNETRDVAPQERLPGHHGDDVGSAISTWELRIPRSLHLDLRKKGARMIATRIRINWALNEGKHANAVLIDLSARRLLRFEPWGGVGHDEASDRAIDDMVVNELVPYVEKATGLRDFAYIPPILVCPRLEGPQIRDRQQKTDEQKLRCPTGGMCETWTQMFLFLRILNPDPTDEEIVDQMLREEPGETLNVKVRKFYTFMVDTFDNAPKKVKNAVERSLAESRLSPAGVETPKSLAHSQQ